jgi:large subunit ribosomal protein L6
MSRVAKQPIELPSGVEVTLGDGAVAVKGPKGQLSMPLHPSVEVTAEGKVLSLRARDEERSSRAQAGTSRSLLNNLVVGVSAGFERKLELVGVGYRAQAQGAKLNLTLGYSHPIEFPVPEGISIETPSQTEIVIKGIDKQKVGQVAAEIRSLRPPEPYKGKGVKYAGELIVRKEAKKK